MKDADMMIVGSSLSKNDCEVEDYYSFGFSEPILDQTMKGSNDILQYGILRDIAKSQTLARFTRKINTGDSYDRVIDRNSILNVIIAMGEGIRSSSAHTKAFMVRIDFAKGTILKIKDAYLYAHGILMFLGFVNSSSFFVFKKIEYFFFTT